MMRRALRGHFHHVHLAGNSREARDLLCSEPITHVVCDLYLGEGEPLGHDLMKGWKNKNPSLEYVAIFTGSSLVEPLVGGDIDAVFKKPGGLMKLLEVLKARAA